MIYVHTRPHGCSRTDLPTNPGNYATRDGCANVLISGNYSKDITIGSDKDIIIRGDVMRTRFASQSRQHRDGSDRHQLRPGHARHRRIGTNVAAYTMNDVTIEAAIMSIQRSFIVDNWNEAPASAR